MILYVPREKRGWTFAGVIPPGSRFQNSRRRLFWDLKCARVARWHIGQIVSSDFSLYTLFIYLFIKLMTHIYISFHKKGFHGPVLTLIYSSKKSVVLSVHCC